jgi:hypothetical protein
MTISGKLIAIKFLETHRPNGKTMNQARYFPRAGTVLSGYRWLFFPRRGKIACAVGTRYGFKIPEAHMDSEFKGSTQAEHRRFPRAKIKLWVHFKLLDQENSQTDLESMSEDFGAGGIAMRSDHDLEPGQHLMLMIYLPKKEYRVPSDLDMLIFPEEECLPVTVLSRVVWVKELEDHEFIMGVKFLAPDQQQLKLLKEFLVDFNLDNPDSKLFTE